MSNFDNRSQFDYGDYYDDDFPGFTTRRAATSERTIKEDSNTRRWVTDHSSSYCDDLEDIAYKCSELDISDKPVKYSSKPMASQQTRPTD